MTRDDDPDDTRFVTTWREEELPYLEVRLAHPRPIVAIKAGKPRATGELTPWLAEVGTGPAGFRPSTGDPERLRAMARILLDAADELEARTADAPRLALGIDA